MGEKGGRLGGSILACGLDCSPLPGRTAIAVDEMDMMDGMNESDWSDTAFRVGPCGFGAIPHAPQAVFYSSLAPLQKGILPLPRASALLVHELPWSLGVKELEVLAPAKLVGPL